MGGSDEPSNITVLTVEEHAKAHKLLWEKYGKKEDYLAFNCLSGQISKKEIWMEKSKLGGLSLKGKKKPDGFGSKISKSLTGRKLSEETKKKISESHKGKKVSDETKKRISNTCKEKNIKPPTGFGKDNSFYGRKHTEETKKKISDTKKGVNE